MEPLLCAGTGDIAVNKINRFRLYGTSMLEGRRVINKDKDSVSDSDRVGGPRASEGDSSTQCGAERPEKVTPDRYIGEMREKAMWLRG